jgi:hypothetical protein
VEDIMDAGSRDPTRNMDPPKTELELKWRELLFEMKQADRK